MKSKLFRSIYAPYITEFIELRRRLGYKCKVEQNIFLRIDTFILEHENTHIGITREITEKWAEKCNNESDTTRYNRIICLKKLSEHIRNQGFRSYIPQLPKYPGHPFIPYIYTHEEINAIFKACDGLRIKNKRMDTSLLIMPCLLRLLYGTGIRIGEALSLKNEDVNIDSKYLTIRDSKNGKDRLIPITNTLADVFKEYLLNRNRIPVTYINQNHSHFFVSPIGLPCKYDAVSGWFHKILAQACIPLRGNRQGPRIHDLRHSFACHSFVKLSDDGADLYCSWPYLSTYLGHESLTMTEQYIRLTAQMYPELLKGTDGLYVNILHEDDDNQKEEL